MDLSTLARMPDAQQVAYLRSLPRSEQVRLWRYLRAQNLTTDSGLAGFGSLFKNLGNVLKSAAPGLLNFVPVVGPILSVAAGALLAPKPASGAPAAAAPVYGPPQQQAQQGMSQTTMLLIGLGLVLLLSRK